MTISAADIRSVTKRVTTKWTEQRKAEERGRRSRNSRRYVYSDRVDFTEVAPLILPQAYEHASGGGQYHVKHRQLYYASRQRFLELTGRNITADYFSNNLLRKYLNRHAETEAWKIAADARGHLLIPNAGYDVNIPMGTLEIEDHLRRVKHHDRHRSFDAVISVEWPSLEAGQRYAAVLYIEKEGYGEMLAEARIAERFDIAILSGKGQSTAAARRFVDEVCAMNGGVPLYTLSDFDKWGFIIDKRLTTVSAKAEENDMVLYEFQNEVNTTHLGLRLDDVNKYGLLWAAEDVPCKALRCRCFRCEPLDQSEYGLTDDEYDFFMSGRRVELNALTSPQFIALIEAKLTALGLRRRLVPADDILADAYRRAMAVAELNRTLREAHGKAIENADAAPVPKTLRRMLRKQMKDTPEAWDKALYRLAESRVTRSHKE